MEIAQSFFDLNVDVSIIEGFNETTKGGTTGPIDMGGRLKAVEIKYRLNFDNKNYVSFYKIMIFPILTEIFHTQKKMRKKLSLKAHSSQLGLTKITAETLLEMFPFGLLIDKNMKIVGAGEKMMEV
jgi:hypothetical protein